MKFAASSKSADAPDIEAGLYDAKFLGVEAKVIEKSQFNPNCFEWSFGLYEEGKPIYDEGEPLEVTGLTSQSVNTQSKTTPGAVRFLKALMTAEEWAIFEQGEAVAEEDRIEAESLVGRMVQVEVEQNANGWPVVKNVIAVRRSAKGKASAK